ncbi:terminase family protein [Ruminococcaceae bacterium OttesenSCG-928-D13]|nr:terminase family protein [Ruminococcaceae bacterium OttesenSCG-928-D13]
MPFSDKQQEYLMNATHRWNIKTGATASGKTFIDYTTVIPKRIENCTGDGLIVLIGNNINSVERNVLSPMREIWTPGLVSAIRQGNNTVMIFGKRCFIMGADKINQVARLQGTTVEYAYGDEVTTWNQEFFEMLKSRLRAPGSVFDGTCNPAHPTHWFKEFLDGDADIYQQHYQLDDNADFLPPGTAENIKREYAGTVYYDRYVLGRWVAAEGIIYRKFADNTESFIVDAAPDDIVFSTIGVDFGDSGSAHAFNCTGYRKNLQGIVTLDEYRSADIRKKTTVTIEMDANDLAGELVRFVKRQIEANRNVTEIRADSAAQTLIRTITRALQKAGIGIPVRNAMKGPIFDRIGFYVALMGANRYRIMRHCKHTIDAFSTALWNSKHPDARLDDGTTNIDNLDAQEYSTEPYQKQMIDILMLGGQKLG